MALLMKKVETYQINTMEEAEQFVQQEKTDPDHEGYEVKSYKIRLKEKKSKGEIVDSFALVEIVKVWNE